MRQLTVRRLAALAAIGAAMTACADATTAPRAAGSSGASTLTLARSAEVAPTTSAIAPAPPAKWTVMVYLAADNNLAPAGVADVDEIEAGAAELARAAAARNVPPGSDVQVVVQAEFSKPYLQQAGCQTPACVRLPSWNTVRFAATGRPGDAPAGTHGPQGPVEDLGTNRDMTKPEELRDFVQWAKTVRPAEHYMLVLWNHGGGYTGLIADETSAGNRLMTIDGMREGITGVGTIDVLDLDMCLMAGYETLAKIDGLAKHVVFSEATVPGAGNEYRMLLTGLGEAVAKNDADPRAVAELTADQFHASYDKTRETTTVSAYDLTGFAAFDAALGRLADGLRERLADEKAGPDVAQAIHDAVLSSQHFDYAMLKDVVDVLDSLDARTAPMNDAALSRLIADVRGAAVANGFRLRTLARSGADARALKVDRATGLDILWPSGGSEDAIRDSGPSSLDAYEAMMPDRPWTKFLRAYLARATSASAIDQEDLPLQAFLMWDPEANAKGADVDFWVIEPDGNLYIPYLGRVTPNGQLTADSWETGNAFEGYATFRYVTRGTYYILANLAQDSANTEPLFNLAYRHGTEEDFSLLYDEHLQLSFQHPVSEDPDASFERVMDGWYTDLQLVAEWTPGGADSRDGTRSRGQGGLVPRGRVDPNVVAGVAPRARPKLSATQIASARRLVAARRAAAGRRHFGATVMEPALRRLSVPWKPR